MALKEKDLAIFRILQEFPCLPIQFIGELWGEEPIIIHHDTGKIEVRYEHIRKRLPTLKEQGYLTEFVSLRSRIGQKKRSYCYALTDQARQLLEPDPLAMRLTNNVQHDLGASMVTASMRLGMRANGLRYISPKEFLERKDKYGNFKIEKEVREGDAPFAIPCPFWYRGKLVEHTPDGRPVKKKHDWHPFGVGFTDADGWETKLYFPGIEFDCDSEGKFSPNPYRPSIERHLAKVLALYDEWYKPHYGTNSLYLPIVTTGPVERWTEVLLKLTDGKGHDHILFRHMPNWNATKFDCGFPPADGHMLTQTWLRAGHPPVNLLDLLGVTAKRVAA